jgi:DNA-directed RNA polymerase specialized sigma24 family protein
MMADALQEMYFAFHKALQRYSLERCGKEKPVSFKTFLYKIVSDEFSNYCRRWKRYYRRMTLSLDDENAQKLTDSIGTDSYFTFQLTDGGRGSLVDQVEGVLSELAANRLTKVWQKLKAKEIRLLSIWLQYGNDKDLAYILGISPTAAKLRRERLLQRIKKMLRKNDTFFDSTVDNISKA